MERKPDIRYIYFYSDGNAARVLEPTPKKKKKVSLPKAPKQHAQVIHLDVMAVGGIIMAAALMLTLVFGLVRLRAVQNEAARMESYVMSLQIENAELRYEYENSYDLAEVQARAEAMGFIPVEDAHVEKLVLTSVSEVREATFWERITAFFANIFA